MKASFIVRSADPQARKGLRDVRAHYGQATDSGAIAAMLSDFKRMRDAERILREQLHDLIGRIADYDQNGELARVYQAHADARLKEAQEVAKNLPRKMPKAGPW